MFITSTRTSANKTVPQPAVPREPATFSNSAAQSDSWGGGHSEPGQIKWGPALTAVTCLGAVSGLSASGLGWTSAIPAFLVGGVTGFALVSSGVSRLISGQNGDTSATGPISGFAGLVGGVGIGVGGAALALQNGSPLIGLGVGAGVAAVAVGALLAKS